MPTVALLEKVYGALSPETFDSMLSSLCKGLKIRLKIVGRTDRGWIQVDVSGEDKAVALWFLDHEIGLAPFSVDRVKKFSAIRGRVIFSGKSRNELYVDVGVFSPAPFDATISLQKLQAQLADGKKVPMKKLIELYCLYNNLPLKVKLVNNVDAQKGKIEAELSEAQLSQIARWIRIFLDRLIVIGAPFSEVKRAITVSKHARDVVKIERLGFLEYAVLCKLGTDAVGLVPRVGRFLPKATLVPFRPREIQKIVA